MTRVDAAVLVSAVLLVAAVLATHNPAALGLGAVGWLILSSARSRSRRKEHV